MNKILKYVLLDILKNRFTFIYGICLLAVTLSLYTLDENSSKATLSMLNIVLLFIPLVSIMFTTIYYYNSIEFITLILAQPVTRMKIYFSLFTGIALSLILAFVVGVGVPVMILSPEGSSLSVVFSGIILTLIFCSLAMLFSVWFRDKARGLGVSMMIWIFFMLIYDGILMFIMFGFNDYPLERLFISLTLFNPIDLARIFVLLQLDISALMGVTGAVFKDFFGNYTGVVITIGMLCIWFLMPLWVALRYFSKKDF